jgi:iron complex outermembrane receptor protein
MRVANRVSVWLAFVLLTPFCAPGVEAAPGNGSDQPSPAASASPAQSTADPSSDTGSDVSATLGEIIVTAERRKEKIQEVPIAITAFTPDQLQKNDITSVQDLQFYVPSMTASGQQRDQLSVTLRGQGVNPSGIPGVINYWNEIPIPGDHIAQVSGGPSLFYDMENVQVLEGPQGTLFGRNSVGGAILFQTRSAASTTQGYAELTYGNYNDRQFTGAVNLPIANDMIQVRVATDIQKRDGFTRSLVTGKELDDISSVSTRATVTLRPNSSFDNTLIIQTLNSANNGESYLFGAYEPGAGLAGPYDLSAIFKQQLALGPRVTLGGDTPSRDDRSELLAADTLRFNVADNVTVRNILGFMKINTSWGADYDGTPYPILGFMPVEDKTVQFTEEAQVLGTSFDNALNWQVGFFYLDSPPQDFTQALQYVYSDAVPLLYIQYRQGAISKAPYAQISYNLTPKLKLTVGARYTWDDLYSQNRQLYGDLSCAQPTNADIYCVTSQAAHSAAPTGTLALDYQISPSKMAYLTIRRGYRTGGYADPQSITRASFGPEFVNDAEVGLKADWQLGTVLARTDIDAYYQDYTDIQTQVALFLPGGLVDRTTLNAATARIVGVEFTGELKPMRALTLGATFSAMDFEYTQFNNYVSASDIAAILETPNNGAPKITYGLHAEYELPLPATLGKLSATAAWSWRSAVRSYYDNTYTSPILQGAFSEDYGLLNLGLNWVAIAGSKLDGSLFVTNATNTVYCVACGAAGSSLDGLGYGIVEYGEPRMYGIRLRYTFE